MTRPPPIDTGLLRAYAAAVYESLVDGDWRAIDSVDGGDWAVLSACNPWSQVLTDAENARLHAELAALARAAGYAAIPARGRAADSSWVEPSWLLRAPLAQLDAWARRFRQHAAFRPPHHGAPAGLRVYSPPADGNRPPAMGNLRLEWVGCDPPSAT
jgi:hypothetical protein